MNWKKRIFGIVLLIATVKLAAQEKPAQPPNILCILVDDLGFGDLSVQGAPDLRTPHIDRLAKEGMTLNYFYANSTVCSPSRAALLSGRYPDMAGVPGVIRQWEEDSWGYLSEEVILLPEILGRQGYHTAIIGKWHLGLEAPNRPNDRGFDHFHGFLGDMMDDYRTHRRGGENWMRLNEQIIDPEGHATDLFTDWTIDYLSERQKEEQPFFLYLAYNAPHFPIQPPPAFLEKVKAREPDLPENRAKNVAFIEHLDSAIGTVMQHLEETGLIENTLVIFTSDNGGALRFAQSNGKLRGGKQDMYEGGIRVPAFVYWKGRIEPGSSSDNFTMLMDLYPTFCELAGAEIDHPVDGISILPTLFDEEQVTDERTVFWMRREGNKYNGLAYYAARSGDYKILQNTPFEPFQYFIIGEDEFEQRPLEETDSEIFESLRKQLQEHIRLSGSVPWQEVEGTGKKER